MTPPKILVFAASTRKGSVNRRLAELAARRLHQHGATVDLLDLGGFVPLPLYDGDHEAEHGVPMQAVALHETLCNHDGVFIASPEYNSGPPPLLVNAFDWVSRVAEHGGMAAAFGRPKFALGAASPGALGGYRGLSQLRQWLELGFGAQVLPAMVTVPFAHEAFYAEGELRDTRAAAMLDKVVAQLVASARGA